jgi:hypothetical protein
LAVGVVLVEMRPTLPYVPVSTTPEPIYAWFDGRPPAVLAELPPGPTSEPPGPDFLYLYASTFHWQRLVNGTSGFRPPSSFEFSEAMGGFPNDRAMAVLRAHGTDYVIIHEEFYGVRYQSAVLRASRRPDLRELSRMRQRGFEVRLYQIVR